MADPSAPSLWRNLSELEQLVFRLSERVEALEARPEVQVLPTTPQEGGPTVVVPIQVQQGVELEGGLKERVAAGILRVEEDDPEDDDPGFKYTSAAIQAGCGLVDLQSQAAILAVADWLESQKVGCALAAARWLREEVERG